MSFQYLLGLLSVWYFTSVVYTFQLHHTSQIHFSAFGRGGGSGGRTRSGYPPSHGLSGTNTYSASVYRSYGQTNTVHTGQSYPPNTRHSYPQNTGLSGNQRSHSTSYVQKTEVHHHYHYAPPQRISYGSQYHPVYQGQPPVYVYQYRDSGSRFDNLLTGLALYNLGRMSNSHSHGYQTEYRGTPGEVCKLVISKSNGEYEETRIECKLISSFIWEMESDQNKVTSVSNRVETSIKVENAGSTVTFQNTNVAEALQVKGPSISVTPGMSCFMVRISKYSSMLKKKVDCALLQQYAVSSLRYNRCTRLVPTLTIFMSIFIVIFS